MTDPTWPPEGGQPQPAPTAPPTVARGAPPAVGPVAGEPAPPAAVPVVAGIDAETGRAIAAAALVAAACSVLVATFLAVLTVSADTYSFLDIRFLERLQIGLRFLSVPVLLTIPLAVALARPRGRPGAAAGPAARLDRLSLVGATVAGSVATFLLLLRLLANLGGTQLLLISSSKLAEFFFDLSGLVIGAASTLWALVELRNLEATGDTAEP
jgi:hypothetical protein